MFLDWIFSDISPNFFFYHPSLSSSSSERVRVLLRRTLHQGDKFCRPASPTAYNGVVHFEPFVVSLKEASHRCLNRPHTHSALRGTCSQKAHSCEDSRPRGQGHARLLKAHHGSAVSMAPSTWKCRTCSTANWRTTRSCRQCQSTPERKDKKKSQDRDSAKPLAVAFT